jgi:hypothetical protein
LQQLRPQQLLRRNRRLATFDVHSVELRRHRFQNFVRRGPHSAQRVILPNPLLRRQITEHIRLLMIDPAHDPFLSNHAVEWMCPFQHPVRGFLRVCFGLRS